MFRGAAWAAIEKAAGLVFDLRGGTYRTGGLGFEVPPALTTRAFRGRFALGLYELPERRLLRRLPRDGCVLDIGGCLGVVSCLVNRRLADPARHLVVEANPALIPWLLRNRDANGARFAVENAIVAEGEVREFWPGGNIVAGSAHRPRGTPLRIPARSVAALEAAHGLRFDTLVMDIEGGEAEFLAANEALLPRLRAALIEWHPQFIGEAACAEAAQRLEAAGLRRRARFAAADLWLREA